jgi:hypothetical protein
MVGPRTSGRTQPDGITRGHHNEHSKARPFFWYRKNEQCLFLTLKASGKLAHQHYEMLRPMIDSALAGVNIVTTKA